MTQVLQAYLESPKNKNFYEYILGHADPKLLELITEADQREQRRLFRHGRF